MTEAKSFASTGFPSEFLKIPIEDALPIDEARPLLGLAADDPKLSADDERRGIPELGIKETFFIFYKIFKLKSSNIGIKK